MRLEELPDVASWIKLTRKKYSESELFEHTSGVVLWTEQLTADGVLLIPVDPDRLVEEIEHNGHPVFWSHDPGRPVGRTMAARSFVTPDGMRFVVGLVGHYRKSAVETFASAGLSPAPQVSLPKQLPDLPLGSRVDLAVDPREVEPEWLDELTVNSAIPIETIELSNNAADPVSELIRIGWPYVVVVWNPFVTSIATEAGKATYQAFHSWLREFWSKLAKRRAPIVALDSSQNGCQVSFLFRGKDPQTLHAAHDALAQAGAQAAALITAARSGGLDPYSLVYEFDKGSWYPAHLTLTNGRLIAEPAVLIALERADYSLSLGIRVL